MKIESIRFKNFNSFGNEWTQIDFNKLSGLILLYGENGTGKSTISEVITFALYGRNSEKKKIHNIVNRFNEHLETEIFLVSKNKRVHIKRNLSPDLFEIYINEKLIDFAYKKNKQQYLDDEIYELSYHIFNNIISLSVSDFKSFTKRLPQKDKQNIIDKIFNIEFISKMYNLNKEYISSKRNNMFSINKLINELSKIITETNLKITENKKKYSIDLQKKSTDYINVINNIQTSINNLKTNLQKIQTEKTELNNKLLNGNITYAKLENEIKNTNKKIKLYKNNKCPLCNSDLTTKEHKNHLIELNKLNDFYKTKEDKYNIFYQKITEHINNTEKQINKYNININIENNKLIELQVKLKELKELKEFKFEDLNNVIIETTNKIKEYNIQNTKITEELQILKIVNDVLNDNGVKRILFNKIIPSFNKEVKLILDKLGINFNVNIDNKFNTFINYLGKSVPIDTLSTGQLKKIDIAIILTFVKILKTKYSNLNILFLDEIFASIDIEGRYGIMTILNEMALKYNLNIIVVNHSELPSELFNYTIKTQLKDNFSELEIKLIK